MMRHKNILAVAFMVISMTMIYGQQTVKEDDYTLVYNKSKIALQFNPQNAQSIVTNVIDVNSKKIIPLQKEGNYYIFDHLTPAEIIRVDYQLVSQKSNNTKSAYLAVPSSSTGAINVYFNHPVDTSYAQIQSAVNLADTVDNLLISYINACQSTLDIAIYSSYSPSATTGIAGAINAAHTRGVQVRVIYDGTASSLISLLNAAIPTLPSPTTSSYTIMHNKFVIFDANNANATVPYVWTGSTNWTTAQIDGPDKNSVIVIQDQALALGYKIEFEEMWGGSGATPNLTNSKFGQYKTDNTPHHYIIGGKTVDSYFSPSDGTTAKIVSAINSANTDIEAAVMDITRTDCSAAIINRYNAGVIKSNVMVDSQNPTGNQITTLQNTLTNTKAVVYSGTGIMHHKFMVVDNYNAASDPLVLLGSHNWSTGAETKNDENTLIVHDLNIANQYFQAFAYLFQLAGGILATPSFQDSGLSLYPNPSRALFTIAANNLSDVQLSVFDILGKKVWTTTLDVLTEQTIDLSNQSSGIYLLEVQSQNTTRHYKLVKE